MKIGLDNAATSGYFASPIPSSTRIADLSEAVRLDPFDSTAFHALESARQKAKDAAKAKPSAPGKADFLKDLFPILHEQP